MRFLSRATLGMLGCLILLVASSLLVPLASASTGSQSAKASATQLVAACPQIVPGENLLARSDAQLMALGLPNRAIIRQNPTRWSHAGKHVCGKGHAITLPVSTLSSQHTNASVTPYAWGNGCGTSPGIQCQNGNWAGYEATPSNGVLRSGYYTFAGMEFTVPSVVYNPNYYSSVEFWTGLGGCYWSEGVSGTTNNKCTAVQAGIWEQSHQPILPWVRVFQPGQLPDPAPVYTVPLSDPFCQLLPGDDLQITVTSNFQGAGYDSFGFDDWTSECYSTCYVHTTGHITDSCGFAGGLSAISDGANGECMAEGFTGTALAQFGTAHVLSCDVETNSGGSPGAGIGDQPHNSFIMYDGPNGYPDQLLAACGPITYSANSNEYSSFDIYWYRPGYGR